MGNRKQWFSLYGPVPTSRQYLKSFHLVRKGANEMKESGILNRGWVLNQSCLSCSHLALSVSPPHLGDSDLPFFKSWPPSPHSHCQFWKSLQRGWYSSHVLSREWKCWEPVTQILKAPSLVSDKKCWLNFNQTAEDRCANNAKYIVKKFFPTF